jgi:hypothetical protein
VFIEFSGWRGQDASATVQHGLTHSCELRFVGTPLPTIGNLGNVTASSRALSLGKVCFK